MKSRSLGVGLIAALTLATSASVAAATPKLWLIDELHRPEKTRVVPGEEAVGYVEIARQCENHDFGIDYDNGLKTDKLNLPPEGTVRNPRTENSCHEGHVLRGTARVWLLSSTGELTVTAAPKFTYGEPGWCVYEFNKFEGGFSTSPYAPIRVETSVTARLDKLLTLGEGCAARQSLAVVAEPRDEDDQAFEVELVN